MSKIETRFDRHQGTYEGEFYIDCRSSTAEEIAAAANVDRCVISLDVSSFNHNTRAQARAAIKRLLRWTIKVLDEQTT